MNNTVLALVVGLIAGVCGAFVPVVLRGDATAAASSGEVPADLKPLMERLDRIEAILEHQPRTATLRGSSGGEPIDPEALAAATGTSVEALLDRIDARVRATVKETATETWKELGAGSTAAVEIEVPEKKKMTIAEIAEELELSSYEEAELRRIHEETLEGALKLLATEDDGGVEGVRRELDEAKRDPAKRMALVGKYMGRLLGNIGGFMVLGQQHEKKIETLIGKDKAHRLESEYSPTDVDPYDLESLLEGSFGD